MIMVSNVSALIGYGFCIYAEVWAVLTGRFFLGLAIGGYCVFCPKFVNEITPIEFRGPVGAMS
jgi:MFS family permease